MLSGESAIGPFGQKAVSVLQMASSRMELWSREENRQSALCGQRQLGESLHDRIAEQICNCAVDMGGYLLLFLSIPDHLNPALLDFIYASELGVKLIF